MIIYKKEKEREKESEKKKKKKKKKKKDIYIKVSLYKLLLYKFYREYYY